MSYTDVREKYHLIARNLILGYAAMSLMGAGFMVFGAITDNIYLKPYWMVGLVICASCIVSAATPYLGSLCWIGVWTFLIRYPFPEDPEIMAKLKLDPEYGSSPFAYIFVFALFGVTFACFYHCTLSYRETKEKWELTCEKRRRLERM